MNLETANRLREIYPNYIPLDVAAQFLAVSPRRLSKLIAEGRQPYASIGANIGTDLLLTILQSKKSKATSRL